MHSISVSYVFLLSIICFEFKLDKILAESASSSTPSQLQGKKNKDENNEVKNDYDVDKYTFNVETCSIQTTENIQDIIYLKSLARLDGIPRFATLFNVSFGDNKSQWEYSFNPCEPVNLPLPNPHVTGIYGDRCLGVVLCKNGSMYSKLYYYTLGINNHDNVKVEVEVKVNQQKMLPIFTLVFTGIESLKYFKSRVQLICDQSRTTVDSGLFVIESDNQLNLMTARLHHACCCPGACSVNGTQLDTKARPDGEVTLVLVGTLVSILLFVTLIGGLCYVKRTHLHFYYKLPALHPGGTNNSTIYNSLPGQQAHKNSDFRDYEPASISSARKKMIPVLADSSIKIEQVEMGQRLGGGIFGDTHLAKWNEMTVTVKRLTLAIHDNQLTTETMEWMKNEVWFLSRQRHRNIVCILGLCLNGRLPFLLTEYVIGECLKDFIKVNGKMLTWPQRIRLCNQVADGMAFLHSTKPPIIHRDLRCGNLFLSDNDLVKVADFGLTKLLQPLREQCTSDECSCQRQLSACPATVRWTAPEILTHPNTKEGENGVISTSCDMYSFGMVMWELVHCKDPFDEIETELEVIEIVRNGGRPDTSNDILPQFKELMKICWDQRPNIRPQFKQVAVRFKELITPARSYQKQLSSIKSRSQKLSETIEHVVYPAIKN